ncbi:hypothetical protein Hdeb2414_s0007g00226941 [Helianthus debilis subsp. tardiflorus]
MLTSCKNCNLAHISYDIFDEQLDFMNELLRKKVFCILGTEQSFEYMAFKTQVLITANFGR